MKKYIFIVGLAVGCIICHAQHKNLWVKPLQFGKQSKIKNNDPDPALDSAKAARLNNLYASRFIWPPATYSHSTDRGDVYNLPIDNMACLVPYGYSNTMPNANPSVKGNMPNAIVPWPIIPKTKPKKKQE